MRPVVVAACSLAPLALLLSAGCTTVEEHIIVHGSPDASDDGATATPPDDDAGAEPGATDGAAGTQDGATGKDAGRDAATPPGYPAAHPPIPQVTYQGGALLVAPKLVTVTFASDDAALRARLEQFDDTITTTPWWTAVTDGYCKAGGAPCIGPGTAGGHVQLTDAAPQNVDDSAIQTSIQGWVATSTLPAPTTDTLYVLYYPQGTTITLQGMTSCANGGFGGYHNEVAVTPPGGAQMTVAYAVIPRCGAEAITTFSASHELVEAATDAHPFSAPGYLMNDPAWAMLGGEVGDLCVDVTGANADQYAQSGFTVQRTWSFKSAAASHDPCVPETGGAYFNAAPATQTIQLAVGETQKIAVTGFSDGPTAPWSLSAEELSQLTGGQNVLTLSLDGASMQNGGTATLSVTLNAAPPQNAAVFALVSTSGDVTHLWPAIVAAK